MAKPKFRVGQVVFLKNIGKFAMVNDRYLVRGSIVYNTWVVAGNHKESELRKLTKKEMGI